MTGGVGSIGCIGTGIMGGRMARRLAEAGYRVAAWNRTRAKAEPLVAHGVRVAATPGEAVAEADVVILMLADGASVAEVLFQSDASERLRPATVVVDMGSIPPPLAREHARRLAERGISQIDAPVSGGPGGAEAGTLAIMAGGEPEPFERVKPVLSHLGRPTLVGPAGAGQLAKLCNQVIVALTIGAVSEALLLAASGGADPDKVREAVKGGFADSLVLKVHGQRMLDRTFAPGGPSRLQLKDLDTIVAEAKAAGLDLPLVNHVAAMFRALVARGGGDLDHSALLLEIERESGGRLGRGPDHLPEHVVLKG